MNSLLDLLGLSVTMISPMKQWKGINNERSDFIDQELKSQLQSLNPALSLTLLPQISPSYIRNSIVVSTERNQKCAHIQNHDKIFM